MGDTITLTPDVMEKMSLDMLRGIAETVYGGQTCETPDQEAQFKQRVPIGSIDGWDKERCIAFVAPYKPQIRRPAPPPGMAKMNVKATAANVPEGWELGDSTE